MSQRILIIDDDARLCVMLEQYLSQAGYQVTSRHTIADGLTEQRRASPDAIILDLMLPDGSGLDVCTRLRAVTGVPILMLTARGEPTDRVVGLELGADDYLPKPFEPRELLARLRTVLRRGAPVCIVVNDRRALYPEILERAGLRLEERLERHVNRRPGRRAGEYYESILICR